MPSKVSVDNLSFKKGYFVFQMRDFFFLETRVFDFVTY